MRTYAYIALLVAVLSAPFILRAMIVKPTDARPIRGKGAVRTLVVITPHNQDIRREFARAFAAWHLNRFGESVAIDYRTPGGTNDIKRQLADTYASWRRPDGSLDPRFVPDAHVVWGGGPYFHDVELKSLGVLQPVRLDPALLAAAFPNPTLAGFPLYEQTTDASGAKTPKWVGVCLSAFGIVYNPDVLRGLGVPEPQTWRDLTHPGLAGQLALADPTHSGSAATAYMIVVERRMADAEEAIFASHPGMAKLSKPELARNSEYQNAIAAGWKQGMSDLVLIAANGRYFVDSAPIVPNDVGNGDAAAGIAIDFYGRVYEGIVGPQRCRVVLPAGATAINPDPVAVLEGVRGADLELAIRFEEFLITPEGQLVWILKPGLPGGPLERALRRSPIRADMYADRAGWTDDVNLFEHAHGFNQRADFESLFTDTRAVWTAAWVDNRELLRSAYLRILRVSDPSRRAALIADLADLPITMADVARASARRKQLGRGASSNPELLRDQIEMTKRFRAHFERVADRAG